MARAVLFGRAMGEFGAALLCLVAAAKAFQLSRAMVAAREKARLLSSSRPSKETPRRRGR